ncbi:Uncharacterised protein r2_g2228 [Pycnogonum litorale]
MGIIFYTGAIFAKSSLESSIVPEIDEEGEIVELEATMEEIQSPSPTSSSSSRKRMSDSDIRDLAVSTLAAITKNEERG